MMKTRFQPNLARIYRVPAPEHERALKAHLQLLHRLRVDTDLDTVEFCIEAHEYIHGNPNSEFFGYHEHYAIVLPEQGDEWAW
jgi:hypothetical protein